MKNNLYEPISKSLYMNIQNNIIDYIKACLPGYDYFILKYSDKIKEESTVCFSVFPEVCDNIRGNWKTNPELEKYDLICVNCMAIQSHHIHEINTYMLIIKKKCNEELVDMVLNQFGKAFGVYPEDIDAKLYDNDDSESMALSYLKNKISRDTCAKQSIVRVKEFKERLVKEKESYKRIYKKLTKPEKLEVNEFRSKFKRLKL